MSNILEQEKKNLIIMMLETRKRELSRMDE
jgi:hypothetical protein